jgi:hypothetical protein
MDLVLVMKREEGVDVGYGALFEEIMDSSLAENLDGRCVFQDMVILADEHDNVMMTVEAFSRRTRWPMDRLTLALRYLMSPDASSKSTLEEGRRLTPIYNHTQTIIGFHVVNRHYYKRMIGNRNRNAYMRRYRAKKQDEAYRKSLDGRGDAA